MSLIRIEHIEKRYRTTEMETAALGGVSLDIEKGDTIAITGRSGSGKSTLLNILGLIEKPTLGDFFFKGQKLDTKNESTLVDIRRNHFGFIFQDFNLIEQMTVAENVSLPLKYRGIDKYEREKITLEMLRNLGIDSRSNHYPNQLSGGQQQRVAIARAAVGIPDVIFADEPTGNLDSENSAQVLQLLMGLNKQYGVTVVLVTHDTSQALMCNRHIKMLDGLLE